jgi:hypothetical protein
VLDCQASLPHSLFAYLQWQRHFQGKGGGWHSFPLWYAYDMNNALTISEFARLGGKARAAKLTKEQLSAIGKKGGRPRKKLDKTEETTPNP